MLFFLVSSKTILAAVWCATVYCRNCRSTVVPWVLPLSCRSTDLNTSTMSLRKFQVFRETASQMCLVPPAVACCHLLFFTDWVFCLEKFWFQNLSRVTTMVRHLYWLIMLVLLTWWQYNFSFSVSIVRIKSKWPMPPSPPKKKKQRLRCSIYQWNWQDSCCEPILLFSLLLLCLLFAQISEIFWFLLLPRNGD